MRPLAGRLLASLQALQPYRSLARKLMGREIQFRVASAEEALQRISFYRWDESPETIGQGMVATQPRVVFLVASRKDKILGSTTLQDSIQAAHLYPGWWLFSMQVQQPFRGAGIGEGLTRLALQVACEHDAERVNLLVFERNQAARALYRKMGFQPYSIPALERELEKEVRRGEQRRIILSCPLQSS